MKREDSFRILLNPIERQTLETLAQRSGTSQASVVRILLLREAEMRGLPYPGSKQDQREAENGA